MLRSLQNSYYSKNSPLYQTLKAYPNTGFSCLDLSGYRRNPMHSSKAQPLRHQSRGSSESGFGDLDISMLTTADDIDLKITSRTLNSGNYGTVYIFLIMGSAGIRSSAVMTRRMHLKPARGMLKILG